MLFLGKPAFSPLLVYVRRPSRKATPLRFKSQHLFQPRRLLIASVFFRGLWTRGVGAIGEKLSDCSCVTACGSLHFPPADLSTDKWRWIVSRSRSMCYYLYEIKSPGLRWSERRCASLISLAFRRKVKRRYRRTRESHAANQGINHADKINKHISPHRNITISLS